MWPGHGRCCAAELSQATEHARERRPVVDVRPTPDPEITEYQRVSKRCTGCGTVTTPERTTDDPTHAEMVATPGSPVRIGPQVLARVALLICARYLPIGRSRDLLEALTGIDVSTGFLADKTPGRTAGGMAYVHVACTEYLTSLHVGDRASPTIDAGDVLPAFTGTLVRDGYTGYAHLPAAHAWCVAHLLRDLRAVSDADPAGQLWATAMATTLTEAHHTAQRARERGDQQLSDSELHEIRNHYLGALVRGDTDNDGLQSPLAQPARTLIARFRRFEDMILRFTAD